MTDTREIILDNAELLFADKGFDAVSIRDIVSAADVNIAAVNYHFGSKQDLIIAVVERRITQLNDERLRRLEALRKQYKGKTIKLRKLIECFVKPAFHLGKIDQENGSKFMCLMGRVLSNSNPELKEKVIGMFDQVVKEFLMEVSKSLNHIPKQLIAARFYFAVGSMAHTLMNQTLPASLAKNLEGKQKLKDMEEELIDFIVGGLNAS